MKIEEIFKGLDYVVLRNGENKEFKEMDYDSRSISKNDVFVALVGSVVDGHNFIDKAINQGASMIIVERDDIDYPEGINVIYVKNLREKLGKIASNFMDILKIS